MDNHPHHTFGFLVPRFATPLTLLYLCAQNLSKIDNPISHLWLPVSKIVKGVAFFWRKFWIKKMKVATPVTSLALWVENLATLSHFWLFGTFFVFSYKEGQCRTIMFATPFTVLALWVPNLAHFWLSVSKFWHPSHTFGSLEHCLWFITRGVMPEQETSKHGNDNCDGHLY